MRTYYTILTAIIRPDIQERISVGLLLIGEKGVHFNYSRNKLAAVRAILRDEDYRLFKDYLQLVVTQVAELKQSSQQTSLLQKNSILNSDYINYLSRYNNNLLTFSPIKSIDVNATEDVFEKLFVKFIDDLDQPQPIYQKHSFETFKRNNVQKLKVHFNIEKTIDKEVPGLLAPIKIDLIGMNAIPVYAQSIEMDRKIYYIENDIAKMLFFRDAFEEKYPNRKEFIVSREPEKTQVKQHAIWRNLRSAKEFTYVDESEAEKIIEYAEEHNVKPLVL